MKKISRLIYIIIFLFPLFVAAQGSDCSTASPFCTATDTATFPAQQNTVAPVGPNYGCLGSQPNPAWFYLQVSVAGSITLNMSNSANVDIDYIIWGPFTSPGAACSSGLTDTAIDCDYSSSPTAMGTIPAAIVGDVYVLLITNYSNQPTIISLSQTSGPGAGITNCNILCAMDSMSAIPGTCNNTSNLYDLTGTVVYTDPPTTGTLTIFNSCSFVTQVFNAPFNPDSTSYTFSGLPANGLSCSVTAVFSAYPACTQTQIFIAPPACFAGCTTLVDSSITCMNVQTTLTASGADEYLWSNGDTTSSITVDGTTATYTVIGKTGTCQDTAIAIVTAFAPPSAQFAANVTDGCESLNVIFIADTVGNPGAIYSWQYEGETGSGFISSHTFSTLGCNSVALTASVYPGCSTTFSVPCIITIYPKPNANFIFNPDEISLFDPTVHFTNTSTNLVGNTAWLWDFGDASTASYTNPNHTYANVGNYSVTLCAINPNGCSDTVEKKFEVKDYATVYVPNAFTPNKDGLNESFSVSSFGIAQGGFEFIIFDRWGNQLFKTTNAHMGWNGAIDNEGEVVEEGLYMYYLKYVELPNINHSLIGTVTLIK